MPRLPRLYLTNCLYYVTQGSVPGENIFKDGGDFKMYLNILKKYKEKYGFKLFAFALMPEQLNLLVELEREGTTISMIMHDVSSAYTRYFNGRYERRGHLFRQRFKSVVIEKEPYLLNLVRYIHTKPVQMGLAGAPAEYTFSTDLFYSQPPDERKQDLRNILKLDNEIQEVLELLKKLIPEKTDYADFMAMNLKQELADLGVRLESESFLGSAAFMDSIKAQMEKKSKEDTAAKINFFTQPLVLFSFTVLVAGVVVGTIYLTKTFKVQEEETAKPKNDTTPRVQELRIEPLMALDGTTWVIELSLHGQSNLSYPRYDKIRFKDGTIVSEYISSLGFATSNYAFTINKEGRLVWETMQRNPKGEMVFWQGEATQDGKMKGAFSRQEPSKGEQKGELTEFSFTSLGYKRED
jgi:REP element-mobilizing transposase RayT/NTP pyrophosphatase (non-canonical NTP hydrolase)